MNALSRYGWFGAAALSAIAAFALMGREPAGGALSAGLAAALLTCVAFIARDPRQGILACAAVCFGANGYLFSRKLDSASGPSICNVNDVLNCDLVNSSAASEMFGVPITLFGMGLYLGIAFAAMSAPKSTPRLGQVSGLFAAVSVVYSLYLAYQSAMIGAVCLVCITIYLGNALLLLAAWRELKATGRSLTAELGSLVTSSSLLTIVGTFLVVVLVGGNSWRDTKAGEGPIKKGQGHTVDPNDLATLIATPHGEVALDGTEPILGNPDAPYLVVEWADFGCPHCARAAHDLKLLVRELPNEVQIRFKAYPLSGVCNPFISQQVGEERCVAAAGADCARQQGRFWEMSELLFANQGFFQPEAIAAMAEQVGVDLAPWNTCMADPAVIDGLKADADAGKTAGVMGTPTMYLRGTHGDRFVEVIGGAGAILKLIEAHQAGTPLPAPGPPRQPPS